ncbi:MAG: ABC transporter ATP-binding protein [Sphingobacteriales bacterium SCN 48-20]|uniref:ABC transporter ATP-binding protein n=1 Tax=Terrimonas ferruginea TaxID=249 RepID=UPI00086BE223|nr:ABC transporter ATP-binding protein [Terrimonas ferruginea]MBN8783340.1 ABC transporter ATP-binding protein [Terrimonas ferruginea]ODT95174.1 MAG: ABC transporter ATP-binding protein [Sphingobacteriales bacterium SCN 48-20]OJW39956.1 MAG: ABC transporter ATP-binding protein [Sphingobacteriales bacterium 48-107]
MSVLSVQQISKNYGAVKALNNVSFEVPQGSVYGILGPNGSGKTTLLGIVMDVLKASGGEFRWNGQPGDADQRKKIGTLLETPNFYSYLSAEKNLEIAACIKERGLDDIDRVLQMVNLHQRRTSKFNTYSLGMKQRLAIASALLGDPDILVFDEPTNGLDPAGIAEIRELIIELNRQGKTIIMASHILDEVERVCTHVTIIQKGVLKTSGTVQEVLSASGETDVLVEIAADDATGLETIIRQFPGVKDVKVFGHVLSVLCTENVSAGQINKYCFEKGVVLTQLNMKKKNLETRFLEITGKQSDR